MTLTAPRPNSTTSEDVEALFREARQLRRRRALRGLSIVTLGALLGALTYLVVVLATGKNQPPSRRPSSPLTVAAQRFAGTWHVHTYYIRVQAGGEGTAVWPIHVDCGSAHATPGAACDTVTPQTVLVGGIANTVHDIHDGGHARIRITAVSTSHARAIVSDTTDSSVLPDGPAVLKVTSNDLLYFTPTARTGPSPFGRSGFCGSSASALTLSQQEAAHINCGA